MLQKLLRLFALTNIVFLAIPTQAVLFQAPGAGSEEFQKYALERNQQTYTQSYLRKSLNPALEAHSQVLEFSQNALTEKAAKQRTLEWERIRKGLPLNRLDREVLTLLAEKLKLSQELCRYLLLEPDLIEILADPNKVPDCRQYARPLPLKLLSRFETNDVILIDGKAFAKNQLPSRMITGFYQWRILSDRYEDRSFTGTAEELSNQAWDLKSWVTGHCDEYRFSHPNFEVQVQAQLYFNANCVKPGIPKEKTMLDWAKEHKPLMWGLGILATGIIATQLKDKTLVITKP